MKKLILILTLTAFASLTLLPSTAEAATKKHHHKHHKHHHHKKTTA